MADDRDDVDPADPRPDGRFHVLRDAAWYYVGDDRAESISLGPATDGTPGDDWVLTLAAASHDTEPPAGEPVAIRLSPWALDELHVEARSVSVDARQAGHTAECDFCGESVELRRAIPNDRDEPTHRHCYLEAYGGPNWLER